MKCVQGKEGEMEQRRGEREREKKKLIKKHWLIESEQVISGVLYNS